MEYADVNTLLKRTLKSGENYNRYFKDSRCTPSYLGTGDTAFTVSQMKAWANKNAGQTKDLALAEFSKRNLRDTASSIYDFLYNHIQYELDGRRQNLKSPSCAWATRTAGTDCKSYSIFASTILINLGIKHCFRRIKQPGMLPDNWTHVYVIIPKDQKKLKTDSPNDYYLIDATVHDNQEVRFTQKSDTLMSRVSLPQYGLQSPAPQGLAGCVCTPKATTTPVVRERATTLSSVNATTRTTNVAATPRPTTSTRTVTPNTVTSLRSNSVAPVVSAAPSATRTTIVADSSRIATSRSSSTTARSSGAASRGTAIERPLPALKGGLGQGETGATANIVTGALNLFSTANQAAQANNLAVSTGSRDQKLSAVGQSGATSATIQTIGAAAAPYTYGISAILTLIPADLYEKTLGQWFKDGFNCWGTTWTPTKAKTVSQIQIEYMKATALDTMQVFNNGTIAEVEQAINNYMLFAYSIQIGERHWINSKDGRSKCTEKGLKVLIKVLDESIKEVVSIFKLAISKAGHYLETGTAVTHEYPPGGENTAKESVVQKVPQFRIKINPAVYQQKTNSGNATSATNRGIQQAGFGTTGALIIAALIGGAYMYKNS